MRFFLISILAFFVLVQTRAQSDSVKVMDPISNDSILTDSASIHSDVMHKPWYQSHYIKESIVPVSLALGSVAIIVIPGLKESLQKPLSWNFNPITKGIYTNLYEDQIRYAPAIAAFLLSDILADYGIKPKHKFIDRAVIFAVSWVAYDFVVYNGKMLTKSLRPPGRDYIALKDMYSLPSQHTAMAFVAATFLDHELGYISPWISVGGYAAASWVGIARVANNFHWTSDVLMGAAVGILMTNATYWAYDGVMKLFPKKLTISPIIDPQQTGLYVCYKF